MSKLIFNHQLYIEEAVPIVLPAIQQETGQNLCLQVIDVYRFLFAILMLKYLILLFWQEKENVKN